LLKVVRDSPMVASWESMAESWADMPSVSPDCG